MANKVKSYTRKDGTKVKAHVRKTTMDGRFKSAGKSLKRSLEGLVKATKRTKPKKFNIKRDLNKLTRSTKRANAKRR
jgi:hypothetical protein